MTRTAAPGHTYWSGKTYDHSVGLSCAFRQWRAGSHCNKLHGYALKVDLIFSSLDLDDRNWVQDFGGLKEVKEWLCETFDHKTLVARDDPQISMFREMHQAGIIDLVLVDNVGCEEFARMIYEQIHKMGYSKLVLVKVCEHTGNNAGYGVANG